MSHSKSFSRVLRHSRSTLHIASAFGIGILAMACAQDPAFTEKATNMTTEDMRNFGQGPEGDGAASADQKGNQGEISTDGTGSGSGGVDYSAPVNPDPIAEVPGSGSGTGGGSSDPAPIQENPFGRPGPVVSVDFTQNTKPKVDIMWVIDSSGSMKWAQDKLAGQFASFAQKLKESNIDFQVGVTSIDVCEVNSHDGSPKVSPACPDKTQIVWGKKIGSSYAGPLRGEFVTNTVTKTKILRDGPNFIEAFKDSALLGTSASGMEHGLMASLLGVQKSKTDVNAGFLRPDSMLSVIVLSDEEDDSVQMWCEDAYGRTSLDASGNKDLEACKSRGYSPYVDAFGHAPYALTMNDGKPMTTHKFTAVDFVKELNNEVGVGKFRVSAITSMKDSNGKINCPANPTGGPQEAGTNYIRAAELTNGLVENICNSDWSAGLASLGQNVAQHAGKIALPSGKIPFPGTLKVSLNGKELASSEYAYEKSGNYLVLNKPLQFGASVVITYQETID